MTPQASEESTDLARKSERHGKVPDDLAAYLDSIDETLCEEMNAIARLFSQPNAEHPTAKSVLN